MSSDVYRVGYYHRIIHSDRVVAERNAGEALAASVAA